MATDEAVKEFDAATKELGDSIAKLTLMEARNLADYLEAEYGIVAAAGGAMMIAAPGDGDGPAEAAEQTEFDVVLTSFGDSKINVIKVVRGATGLGLKEAKEVVEGVPSKIKEKVSKEDAESLKEELEGAGASVEIK